MTSFERILCITQINQRLFICKTHSSLTKPNFLLQVSSVSKHKLRNFISVVFSLNQIFSVFGQKKQQHCKTRPQYPHIPVLKSCFFYHYTQNYGFKTTYLLHPSRKVRDFVFMRKHPQTLDKARPYHPSLHSSFDESFYLNVFRTRFVHPEGCDILCFMWNPYTLDKERPPLHFPSKHVICKTSFSNSCAFQIYIRRRVYFKHKKIMFTWKTRIYWQTTKPIPVLSDYHTKKKSSLLVIFPRCIMYAPLNS